MLLGLPSKRFCSLSPASSVRPICATDFLQSVPPALLSASRSRFALSTASSALSPLFTLALPSPALCFVRLWFLDGSSVYNARHLQMAHLQILNCCICLLRFFFLRPPLFDAACPSSETKLSSGRSWRTPDADVRPQPPDEAIFCRLFNCFGESSSPAGFLHRT